MSPWVEYGGSEGTASSTGSEVSWQQAACLAARSALSKPQRANVGGRTQPAWLLRVCGLLLSTSMVIQYLSGASDAVMLASGHIMIQSTHTHQTPVGVYQRQLAVDDICGSTIVEPLSW